MADAAAVAAHVARLHAGVVARERPAVAADHPSRFRKGPGESEKGKRAVREDDPVSGGGVLTIAGPLADKDEEEDGGTGREKEAQGGPSTHLHREDAARETNEHIQRFWAGENADDRRRFATEEQLKEEDDELDAALDAFRNRATQAGVA